MGVYLLWAVMTILTSRVYLNLVYLVHGPMLEPTELLRGQLTSLNCREGIQMQVQTTTVGDQGEVLYSSEHTTSPTVSSRKFDSVQFFVFRLMGGQS